MSVWYATREEVKASLDIKATARTNARVDRAIEASSRTLEGILHRRFYPELATKYFDWPQPAGSRSYRIWLEDQELLSITGVTAGGVSQAVGDFFLEPSNSGPPYDRIETNRATSTTFSAGSTDQRAIGVTGIFSGTAVVEESGPIVVGAVLASDASIITGPGAVGVGALIRADNERMTVSGKSSVTTGTTITASLEAKASGELIPVADGTKVAVGEQILIDAEYMLVVDIAGNNLLVKRAVDGSTLAAHSSTSTIYAPRKLNVSRGVLGTTAATHSNGAAILLMVFPGPVRTYCIAQALDTIEQEQSGYARVVGSGDNASESTGAALSRARADAITALGRQARMRTV